MSAFSDPKTHLNAWIQSSGLHVTACLCARGGEEILQDYGFLHGYVAPFQQQFPQPDSIKALDQQVYEYSVQAHEENSAQDFPLFRLQQIGLNLNHLRTVLFAGLVEVDARFGTVYSVLHPFPNEQRLTIGLLEDLLKFNVAESQDAPSAWAVVQVLERQGLIDRHHSDRPRAAQAITVPALVWDALAGITLPDPTEHLSYLETGRLESFEALQGLLPQSLLDRLARLPELVEKGLIKGVVLRGMRGTGRLQAMAAVARSQHKNLLHLKTPNPKDLPHLCRLTGVLATLQSALPVIELELVPGENYALPKLSSYGGLFGILLNHEGSLSGPQAEGCLTLQFPAPNRAARAHQWKKVSRVQAAKSSREQGLSAKTIAQISRYHLTLGAVDRVGQLAFAYAGLNNHDQVQLSDVQAASRALNQQTLENLATHIPTTHHSWQTLIVADSTQAELETFIQRCRHREALLDHLGRGFAGTTRGVRAMFSGTSGTGKTLAARIIAAQLGLELYRVDLSSVISKYIGETERNLSQLFSRAEEQDVVLLLDEGDALLTSRTDVQSANDRYANMETNYLLQRLESYDGIIVITTNAANRIDSAFQRRIDVVIEFGLPDAAARERLWQLHLPAEHSISEDCLQKVAYRCQLTGGQIRNAVLHATLLAVEAGDALAVPLAESFAEPLLLESIQREYTKMGAASPLD